MQQVVDYILSLGSNVFVPLVLFIIGLVFGIGILKSIKTAATVGVGFVGLGLVIGIISEKLTPAVNLMVERFGLNMTVIDVGSGTAAGIAFSTAIGALIIPVVFGVNVLMLISGASKTMNIDVFNYSHYALTGSVVYIISGSLVAGIVAGIFHSMLSLLSADFTAKRVQNQIGIEGISIPQGYASSTVPLYAVLDKIYDRIPFMKNIKIDTKVIQKKLGMIGDPVIIGIFLGILFGLLAGYNFKDTMNLVIAVVGIMVLFPRMIKIIVEGLLPISEAAKNFFNTKFKGKEVYIGLDSAVTLGHPTTITVGILLIPITLLMAAILPGNKVLPLADLPFVPFFICMATIIHKGDMLRTLISSTINMILVLLIASWFTPYFTELANTNGFNVAEGGKVSALYIGNVFDLLITKFGQLGVLGFIVLAAITVGGVIFVKKNAYQE
ncbi:PTS galactitol transporter subunit IIC [Brassicibacter mesophilus]|uniref:PTS galactitol transporter subunit IIC n=1 Tax=Brassicibacter mesophilus TaxID=745119 RepID=UPI003D1B2AF9